MPRPATGSDPQVSVRLPRAMIVQLKKLGKPSEVIRELLEDGLRARAERQTAPPPAVEHRPSVPYAFLSESQLRTADRLIHAINVTEVGALKAIDYSKPRVDGDGGKHDHGIHRERMRGLEIIRKARLKLGDQAFGMLCDFLLAGIPGHESIIRDALDRIAYLFDVRGAEFALDGVKPTRTRHNGVTTINVRNDSPTPRPKAPVRFVGFGKNPPPPPLTSTPVFTGPNLMDPTND